MAAPHDEHGSPTHETREQTLERVTHEQEAIYPHVPCADNANPTVRRRFPGRLAHWIIGTSLAGAVIGFLAPLALGAGVDQAIIWAVSVAVVLGCTLPLLVTEDEDGWRNRFRVPEDVSRRRR